MFDQAIIFSYIWFEIVNALLFFYIEKELRFIIALQPKSTAHSHNLLFYSLNYILILPVEFSSVKCSGFEN